MRKNIVSICVLALLLVTFSVFGQEDRNKGIINSALIGLEYEVKAGFNIGGTAPIPLPVEIRDITGYNPTMAVAIEGNVTKWFDQEKKWGMRIGIRLDSKGMKTNANVKNYGMEIIGEGGERIKGNWTGYVKTNVKNTYLSALLHKLFVEDKDFLKSFEEHSAAKTVHHGFIGGLMEHTLSVTVFCLYVGG